MRPAWPDEHLREPRARWLSPGCHLVCGCSSCKDRGGGKVSHKQELRSSQASVCPGFLQGGVGFPSPESFSSAKSLPGSRLSSRPPVSRIRNGAERLCGEGRSAAEGTGSRHSSFQSRNKLCPRHGKSEPGTAARRQTCCWPGSRLLLGPHEQSAGRKGVLGAVHIQGWLEASWSSCSQLGPTPKAGSF